ncbi:MAG TPA: hypothetical protein VGI31_03745 [Streptosporangiaceae bacterium]
MFLLHTLSQLSASVHPGLLVRGPEHVSAATASVPNPAPLSPTAGGAIVTLIAWVKWLALVACGASAVIAGGMIAIGSTSYRTGLADRGKTALLWSVVGAVVVSVGIPLVNRAFSIG